MRNVTGQVHQTAGDPLPPEIQQAMAAQARRKREYRAYRELAAHAVRNGIHSGIDAQVRVSDQADVQMVEDGAFVAAVVWVPRSALPKED